MGDQMRKPDERNDEGEKWKIRNSTWPEISLRGRLRKVVLVQNGVKVEKNKIPAPYTDSIRHQRAFNLAEEECVKVAFYQVPFLYCASERDLAGSRRQGEGDGRDEQTDQVNEAGQGITARGWERERIGKEMSRWMNGGKRERRWTEMRDKESQPKEGILGVCRRAEPPITIPESSTYLSRFSSHAKCLSNRNKTGIITLSQKDSRWKKGMRYLTRNVESKWQR